MKVLVAEDDPVSAKLLEMSLKQWGFEVRVAGNGEAAKAEYARSPFDVVVTDWMMPEVDGVELTRWIRTVRGRDYPWVVMLTTKVFKDNYAKAMEAGVDDFLMKPLDRELLRVRLLVAARVQRARRQVEELSRVLPICMHCKSVKPVEERAWQRIEEYLSTHTDVSHGFCPECYWDKSVAPDLHGFLKTRATLRMDAPVDAAAALALDEYDRGTLPGIAADARGAFRELVRAKMSADLDTLASGGRVAAPVLARYREAADAIGAGRLRAMLEKLMLAPGSALAPAAISELSRVMDAIFPQPIAVRVA